MLKHEIKTCPRCGRGFECRQGTILLCQCQTVTLSRSELDAIAERFEDCLCADCLQQLTGLAQLD